MQLNGLKATHNPAEPASTIRNVRYCYTSSKAAFTSGPVPRGMLRCFAITRYTTVRCSMPQYAARPNSQ